MIFLFLGVVLLIVGFAINTPALAFARYARPLKVVGVILLALGLLSSSIRQIEAGRVGVQKLFGRIRGEVLLEGLNLVNPFVTVTEFDVKTQNYTMSGTVDEGEKVGDDAIKVLSADGLQVGVDLTVLYRVIPSEAPKVLREIGTDYRDKIVRPLTRTRIRDNAVYYDAVALYSTKRDEFQIRIMRSIEGDFKKRGLVLEQLLIRNIDLPASVKRAIESKINAEQESQKMQFVLAKERQEADRKRVEAQGIADYQKIVATGLTDQQLQYEAIKAQRELAASPNAKIIVMGGKGNVPLLLGNQ
ncbi:MAG: prohibitin family protein [Sphingobacteriaceae bacterium]|nr:prohibitin family protein [Cytophagaceae bacterium]